MFTLRSLLRIGRIFSTHNYIFTLWALLSEWSARPDTGSCAYNWSLTIVETFCATFGIHSKITATRIWLYSDAARLAGRRTKEGTGLIKFTHKTHDGHYSSAIDRHPSMPIQNATTYWIFLFFVSKNTDTPLYAWKMFRCLKFFIRYFIMNVNFLARCFATLPAPRDVHLSRASRLAAGYIILWVGLENAKFPNTHQRRRLSRMFCTKTIRVQYRIIICFF